MAERLAALIAQKTGQMSVTVHVRNVMPDHVHLFVETPPTGSPARLAWRLKEDTSRALRRACRHLRDRLPARWSRSYDIGTVGHGSAHTVRRAHELIAMDRTVPLQLLPSPQDAVALLETVQQATTVFNVVCPYGFEHKIYNLKPA